MITTQVDTWMIARLGADNLSGFALGHTYRWSVFGPCLALLMGLDPLISQAHGRKDHRGAMLAKRRGQILAALLCLPLTAQAFTTGYALRALGQDPQAAELGHVYSVWIAPGNVALLMFAAERHYLQARGVMKPAVWTIMITNVLNAALNWVFIWGHLGAPAMGIAGAGLATSLTELTLLPILKLTVRLLKLEPPRPAERHLPGLRSIKGLWQVLKLGLGSAAHFALEHWAFAGSTFLAGLLGVAAVGGHHVTLTLAATTFMLPLGLSIAASTRIGNLIGENDIHGVRRSLSASLLLGGGVMACCGLLFVTLRRGLTGLYTDDLTIVALVGSTLPIVAAFQISDGVQVIAAGALRSMGKPHAGVLVNLLSYYVCALPLGYMLAFKTELGLRGIWVALAVGVTLSAIALTLWVFRNARKDIDSMRCEVQ